MKNELVVIQDKIILLRGKQIMIDRDLAELYGIETKNLKKAVRRNLERFPSDFMFELNNSEFNSLKNSMKFQNGTSRQGGIAYAPFAFTEQGVAMLSSVLRSTTAIEINIRIMRAFVAVRQYLYANQQMSQEIENLKHRLKVLEQGSEDTLEAINELSEDTRRELDDIYLALSQLADKQKDSNKTTGRKPIGFREYK